MFSVNPNTNLEMLILAAKTSLHHICNWAKHVNYATSNMTCTQAGTKLWQGASYMKYLLVIRDP